MAVLLNRSPFWPVGVGARPERVSHRGRERRVYNPWHGGMMRTRRKGAGNYEWLLLKLATTEIGIVPDFAPFNV